MKFRNLVQLSLFIFSCTAFAEPPKVMMSYWSDQDATYPVPGSVNDSGVQIANQDMQNKLQYLNVIAYAFCWIDKTGIVRFGNPKVDLSKADSSFCIKNKDICGNQDNAKSLGNFIAFTQLQNKNKNLRKLISVGGGGDEKSFNRAILHTDQFVDSVSRLINFYHLDGIDLDFEPAVFTPDQRLGYINIVTKLRKKLDPHKMIIVTIAADQTINSTTWEKIEKEVSFVSDMCYDFHAGSYPPYVMGYNSNLYADANEPLIADYYHISCDQSIKLLAAEGVSPNKIILGYPAYAITYQGIADNNHGLFQLSKQDKSKDIKKLSQHIQYVGVLQLLNNGFTEYATSMNNHISGVWAYNPYTHQLLAYDNKALVEEKASYVMKNNLAGMMMWTMKYDASPADNESLLKAGFTKLE